MILYSYILFIYLFIYLPIALHIIAIVEVFFELNEGKRFFNSSNLDF